MLCPELTSLPKSCQCKRCSSSSMKKSSSAMCVRSYDYNEEDYQLTIPALRVPQNALVDIGNECVELRETVTRQQHMINDLVSELEKEKNASASAADEALSMILRLQNDKAEIQMEARQFKTFAEEKLAHRDQEIDEFEDLLYNKDETIHAISCEALSYKHRMLSFGLSEAEQDGDDELADIEMWETPRSGNDRISQLERSPRVIDSDCDFIPMKNVLEKVIVGESPRTPKHTKRFSTDCTSSPLSVVTDVTTDSPKLSGSFKMKRFAFTQENSDWRKLESASDFGDESIDRDCIIDSVYQGTLINGLGNSAASIGFDNDEFYNARDLENQKLHARLRALEADRESMRQAIITMGTEKAQMVWLKEVAQNWCRERAMPIKKRTAPGKFSIISIIKWIFSIIFWRTPRKCKHTFGLSANNAGLLMLLDPCPRLEMYIQHKKVRPMKGALYNNQSVKQKLV